MLMILYIILFRISWKKGIFMHYSQTYSQQKFINIYSNSITYSCKETQFLIVQIALLSECSIRASLF